MIGYGTGYATVRYGINYSAVCYIITYNVWYITAQNCIQYSLIYFRIRTAIFSCMI